MLISSVLIFVIACKTEEHPEPQPAIPAEKLFQTQLDFETGLELNEDQVNTIRLLGKKLGIQELGRIKTFTHQHGADPGIYVYEQEKREGKKISYRQFYVYFRKWHKAEEFEKKQKLEQGMFWTYTHAISQKEEYDLLIQGKTIRIKEVSDYTIPVVEKIVTAFIEGKYELAETLPDDTKTGYKNYLSRIDFNSPVFISGESIAFNPQGAGESGGSGWYSIQFLYINDKYVEISSIVRVAI
jgi:hypothetical protein